jgi:hypothetical protein
VSSDPDRCRIDAGSVVVTVKVKGNEGTTGRTVEVEWAVSGRKEVKFDFAFDTPDLNLGVPVYTPRVGEILYDLWFDVTIPFDGTTPYADLTVTPDIFGMWGNTAGFYKLDGKSSILGFSNDVRPIQASLLSVQAGSGMVPARFITTDPLKLYVSQNSFCDGEGAPIDSTVGEASLFLTILSPLG